MSIYQYVQDPTEVRAGWRKGPPQGGDVRSARTKRTLVKLGISTWSLPWSVGVRGYPEPKRRLGALGLIEKAVEHGVHVVQIADNLPLDGLSDSELDRVAQAAADQGLEIEVGTRGVEPEPLARYIVIARRLGARSLRTVLGGSMCGAQELAAAEGNVSEILRDLERHQVRLAIENNEAFSAAEFAGLVRQLGSPFVGVCLDTANSLGRPELLDSVVEQLADHTVMVHAKDYDIQRFDTRMGFSISGQAAGDGRVNFDAVLTALRDRGRDDISVIIEHWPPFAGTIEAAIDLEEEWLARSVNFFRSRV